MTEIVLVIALGLAAGVTAGVFGVGGGVIFVPTMTLVLGLGQLEAEATSLLAIIPAALLGTWRQSAAGIVRARDAAWIGGASVISAIAGALVAEVAPEDALRIGFAIVLLVTAAHLARGARRAGESPSS